MALKPIGSGTGSAHTNIKKAGHTDSGAHGSGVSSKRRYPKGEPTNLTAK